MKKNRLLRTPWTALRMILLLLALSLVVSCGAFEGDSYRPPQTNGPSILVDLYHARLQNHEDYRLEKDNYQYQGVFGYHRAFEHVREHGYEVQSFRETPLSAPRLKDFDILFINLVDSNRPTFSADEYRVIDDWVKAGGGLFLIADHTNVYHSSERINPILAPMDMEVGYHTVVDRSSAALVGAAWLMLWDFDPHFVTEGLEMISPQTGGPIFGDHGLAWSSEASFADYWNKEETSGFYGDFNQGEDKELEPGGPLAMVAAREYGKGRVVVVGDQNMFGDAWLFFANNFDLMMNSFQWLAKKEDDSPALREQKPRGFQIGLEMSHNNYRPGRQLQDGYYVHFVHYNRDPEVTAHARLNIDPSDDALILLDPERPYDESDIALIKDYFKEGKTVVLSFNADRIEPGTAGLLRALAPDFLLRYADLSDEPRRIDATELRVDERNDLDIRHFRGHHALISDHIDVDGLYLTSAQRPSHPLPEEGLPPSLLAVSSEWGQPLLQVRVRDEEAGEDDELVDHQIIDIARVQEIDQGRLVILIQDGFWRNRSLGTSEVTRPADEFTDAITLHYRLLDWLKAQ